MSDTTPAPVTPAPAPAPAGNEVLTKLLSLLGFDADGKVAAVAPPVVATTAPKPEPEAVKPPVVAAVAPQGLSPDQITDLHKRFDALVSGALTRAGAPLAPRTPAPSSTAVPSTQQEAMQWARGTPEQQAALNKAVKEGLEFHKLPRF